MNMGAFGENFPYSNFHDLNMDWIIKIAKDFLDQYTGIQDTISDGLTELEAKKTELEGLLQEWYDTHSEDIAHQLAISLAEFIAKVEEKGQDTLDSIPDDYTEMYNKVNETTETTYNLFPYRTTGYFVQQKEYELQKAMLSVQKKYGKNAILKGMNLEEGATARDRNRQIGGHKA